MTNRGDAQSPVFGAEEHCLLFLEALSESVERLGLEVHAFALGRDEFHALVRSVRGNLSRAVGRAVADFTMRAKARSGIEGPLFHGRFRSQILGTDPQLQLVAAYIHLLPVRERLVKRPDDYSMTSYRAYVGTDAAPWWLTLDALIQLHGGADELARYTGRLQSGETAWPSNMDLARGWFRGRTPPAAAAQRRSEPHHQESAPETVLVDVLELTGADESELDLSVLGPGGNPVRRFALWALDRETTLTQSEMGELLGMSPANVAVSLRRLRREQDVRAPVREWMDLWVEHYGDRRLGR